MPAPPRRVGVWPLAAAAHSAKNRAAPPVVAAVAIDAVRGGRRRCSRLRPHQPPWLVVATGARRSPAGCGGAKDMAARGAEAGGHWGGRVGGGRERPPARTRGGSGASACGGGVSADTGARAATRATGRRGRAPPPPRPPVGGHWPVTARRRVPPPTPTPTPRAACPPRVSLGSHDRATGEGRV